MNASAPNGLHHSATEVSDESYYRDSLLSENKADASNDDQKPIKTLIDADYLSDLLSTNEAPDEIDDNISEDSNFDELIGVYRHYLFDFTGFSVHYVLNTVMLILI
ncbi:unnamed protein product [Schistosoma mattheei]|uniref:Uncharacterized protein n=1 Tax=Schistosoma mattheei TaxID=31246 RepID=A0A3P8D5Z1_9TREM|nr:unnamed protein product [Schistosoma mattheei]